MDIYINGEGSERSQTRAAQTFLDTVNLDMETLKLKAVIRDASYLRFISTKPDGFIYHTSSSTMLGRNPADVLEYLKNPLNEEILKDLLKSTEKYWNQ